MNNAFINIIKYAAKEIRSRINKKPISITVATDNNVEISRNFWGYTKKVLKSGTSVLPTFDVVQGTTYFTNSLKCVNCTKGFTIPSWIPKLKQPNIPFSFSPPNDQEITRIIKCMKSSGSQCPLYQISIICFKRYPYLRSFMLNICSEVLKSNTLPVQWTKAATILIHKKGDPSLPENFRPITLEPVNLKIFTSLLRNRVFMYLIHNQYNESHYQKGFMPGMSGAFEDIAEMSHIINHSIKQQRSVTITLIDLKNVFGEVHHSLIQSVLPYHRIPDQINRIVKMLYSDLHLSIIAKDFHTKYIAVEKGGLQGNSFSPLIFNLIINTFIQCVKEEKFTNFGYHTFKCFLRRNWFQFVDDAVAVTSLEGEKFRKWCRWSEMTIKASKCHSFEICKKGTISTRYKPKLYLENALVPPVKLDDCFTYLGRHVDFKMSDDKHKSELIETITDQIEIIDKLPLHSKNKLKLYQQWTYRKSAGT